MKLDEQTRQLTDEMVRFVCEHSTAKEMPDLLKQLVEPVVRGHIERTARLVLSAAMEECETYSAIQTEPAAQLALKQAAIRIAKLAPSITAPKGPGPRKAEP
jgi:hypothetical protein